MLDTHQLNVFLMAAETLNFTQAANRLHMTQPSVSQHIQSLEQHFEQELFLRSGRTIRLTDAGSTLLPLARDLINRSVNIEETMKSLEGEVHGHLLVGCSTTPGKYILPHLLADFHRQFPRVKISCHVAPQHQALQMVYSGEVHFALVSSPDMVPKEVELRKFSTDPVNLIVPMEHPWVRRRSISPEELCKEVFIMREEGSGTRRALQEGLVSLGIDIDELETLLILGNSEAIALAVQEGLGLGFVSSIVVTKLALGRVAPVQVRGLNIEREIFIGRHTRRPATAAQAAFWGFIEELDFANCCKPDMPVLSFKE